MSAASLYKFKWTHLAVPGLAWITFFILHQWHVATLQLLSLPLLVMGTLHAVHHAEVIAEKVGQPFGAMVLALAVTFIEASLIISMMVAGGSDSATLARDAVFAAVMIILNGMLGLSIMAGSIRHSTQSFLQMGVNSELAALVTISVLTLILPNFTQTIPGPYYSSEQLVFVSIVSLIIYVAFVFIQNVKHRDFFGAPTEVPQNTIKPTRRETLRSVVLLLFSLSGVILLAESLAPVLEEQLDHFGAPRSLVGVTIAMVILLPEGLSAYKAARQNDFQRTLNLSLGSALASISLTIPLVSFYALYNGIQLELGIDSVATILFILSLFITMLSLSSGKTTIFQGILLLVVFLVYLFTLVYR